MAFKCKRTASSCLQCLHLLEFAPGCPAKKGQTVYKEKDDPGGRDISPQLAELAQDTM